MIIPDSGTVSHVICWQDLLSDYKPCRAFLDSLINELIDYCIWRWLLLCGLRGKLAYLGKNSMGKISLLVVQQLIKRRNCKGHLFSDGGGWWVAWFIWDDKRNLNKFWPYKFQSSGSDLQCEGCGPFSVLMSKFRMSKHHGADTGQ